jgi:hypothetical protein
MEALAKPMPARPGVGQINGCAATAARRPAVARDLSDRARR